MGGWGVEAGGRAGRRVEGLEDRADVVDEGFAGAGG